MNIRIKISTYVLCARLMFVRSCILVLNHTIYTRNIATYSTPHHQNIISQIIKSPIGTQIINTSSVMSLVISFLSIVTICSAMQGITPETPPCTRKGSLLSPDYQSQEER
eukprot:797077_1